MCLTDSEGNISSNTDNFYYFGEDGFACRGVDYGLESDIKIADIFCSCPKKHTGFWSLSDDEVHLNLNWNGFPFLHKIINTSYNQITVEFSPYGDYMMLTRINEDTIRVIENRRLIRQKERQKAYDDSIRIVRNRFNGYDDDKIINEFIRYMDWYKESEEYERDKIYVRKVDNYNYSIKYNTWRSYKVDKYCTEGFPCTSCSGNGKKWNPGSTVFDIKDYYTTCKKCNGSGRRICAEKKKKVTRMANMKFENKDKYSITFQREYNLNF